MQQENTIDNAPSDVSEEHFSETLFIEKFNNMSSQEIAVLLKNRTNYLTSKRLAKNKLDRQALIDDPEIPTYKVGEDAYVRFKESAPNTLNIDGTVYTQKELVEHDDIMLELYHGNCAFLETV